MAASQYDIGPSQAQDFAVNPESLEATINELNGFAGMEWTPYVATQQQVHAILEITSPISGQVNDYDPAGWRLGAYAVLSIGGSGLLPTLTGLKGGRHGRGATLLNWSATAITIAHQGGASDPENRFHMQGLGALNLAAGCGMSLVYHGGGSDGRWRQV